MCGFWALSDDEEKSRLTAEFMNLQEPPRDENDFHRIVRMMVETYDISEASAKLMLNAKFPLRNNDAREKSCFFVRQ